MLYLTKKTKHLQKCKCFIFREWPSLGSNQGLADYETEQDRFQRLAFSFKVTDLLAVTHFSVYLWFHKDSRKVQLCCPYVELKIKQNEHEH